MSKESQADRYRRLARQCLEILPTISRPAARSTLIEMAERLAKAEERTGRPSKK
jgi:hypothetical protein